MRESVQTASRQTLALSSPVLSNGLSGTQCDRNNDNFTSKTVLRWCARWYWARSLLHLVDLCNTLANALIQKLLHCHFCLLSAWQFEVGSMQPHPLWLCVFALYFVICPIVRTSILGTFGPLMPVFWCQEGTSREIGMHMDMSPSVPWGPFVVPIPSSSQDRCSPTMTVACISLRVLLCEIVHEAGRMCSARDLHANVHLKHTCI